MFNKWMLINSFKVSLVVGSILVAINHWDHILVGNITLLLIFKIILTYCVPFFVSLYGSLSYANRLKKENPY